ncbi:Zinc finger, CCHC domain containing [Perkinsus olseni]|uniref:Zinc finger, CCHC domain containing n=1 Tax=Perkinsus olseni TaxID=32597 RepID=A0A7J6LVP4_PEROL|nr:Zinc finger, CCHC domain containing [Perkinsus olseni]
MSATTTPAAAATSSSGEDATTPPALPRIAEISEASALAAQFVIQHQQQRQEAAKKAAAQSTTIDTTAAAEASPTETNGTSTTTAAIGSEAKDNSPVGAASPAAEVPSSATVNPAELVDSELSSFVERVALTDEDHHVHNHILGSILSVARSNLDIEATIETFGSAASGLSEKSSDIDATIICRFSALKKRFGAAGDEKSLCSAAVMGLGKAISKFEKEAPGVGLRVVQVIPSAKVPIVVLSWIGPNGNVQIVDVSINNQLPLHNTALLRNYVEMDKRVQILALCVKRWAKLCGISDAKQGNLSSYSWTLLCIYFLQVRSKGAILPSLQSMAAKRRKGEQVKHYSCPISGRVFNVDFVDRFEATTGEDAFKPADTPPSELLRDFFVFYDRDYKWGSEVVSIRTGERRSTDEYLHLPRRDTESNILIEDPLDLNRNLNCVLDYEGRIRLRRAFALFAAKVADASMEELLTQAKTLTRMRTGPTAAAMAAKHAQNATMGVGGPHAPGLTAPTLQQHTAMSQASHQQQQASQQQGRPRNMEYMRQDTSPEYQPRGPVPGSMRPGQVGGGPGGGYNMMGVGHSDIRAPSNLVLSPVKDGPGAATVVEGIRGVRVQQQQPVNSGGVAYNGAGMKKAAAPYYQYGQQQQQKETAAAATAVQSYVMPPLGYYLELQTDGHSWDIVDRW